MTNLLAAVVEKSSRRRKVTSIIALVGHAYALVETSSPALSSHPRGAERRVQDHIARGARLRARLGPVSPAQALRLRVREATGWSARAAHKTWRAIVCGTASLVHQWTRGNTHYVVALAHRDTLRDPRALTDHERAVVALLARGESNKAIATALGIGVGSVSTALAAAAKKLGCANRAALLGLAVPLHAPERSDVRGASLGDDLHVIVVPASGEWLYERLTMTEREILSRLAAGMPTRDIARYRGVSVHTVMNQVATILTKTGARSRAELLHALGAATAPERVTCRRERGSRSACTPRRS